MQPLLNRRVSQDASKPGTTAFWDRVDSKVRRRCRNTRCVIGRGRSTGGCTSARISAKRRDRCSFVATALCAFCGFPRTTASNHGLRNDVVSLPCSLCCQARMLADASASPVRQLSPQAVLSGSTLQRGSPARMPPSPPPQSHTTRSPQHVATVSQGTLSSRLCRVAWYIVHNPCSLPPVRTPARMCYVVLWADRPSTCTCLCMSVVCVVAPLEAVLGPHSVPHRCCARATPRGCGPAVARGHAATAGRHPSSTLLGTPCSRHTRNSQCPHATLDALWPPS